MSYALTRYTADGVTLSFTVGFTYRDADDVIVKVDGVLQTFPTDYALTSGGSQVSFPSAPANGAAIFITRSTSQSVRLTDYTAGAIFKESDLDTDSIQAFNMSQEAIDIAKDSIAKDAFGVFDAQGIRIKNVADPINDQDAATKNHVKLALADFKAKYYGASATAPESPIEGGLWWDSVNNIMKVYNGASWESVNSVVNGTANRSLYTVGVSSGAYTGSTTVFPSAYDVGYVDVFLNGVKLIPSTDFTATDGSTIVLASAAANADRVEVIGYGVFELSPFPVSLNVLDYGAVGDGVVDDTASVQAAINASNGTPVVFPAGKSFNCTALTVTSNDHLVIDGTIKGSLLTTDVPLISGANVSNVIIEGKGYLDGGYNIKLGYQGRSATELTTRVDGSPLQEGDMFYDTAVSQFKRYSGAAWVIITAYRAGIKLDKSVDCRAENLTIQNFILTAQPGNWGAGVWFEGDPDDLGAVDSLRNKCVNVNASYNIGCGIVFGANLDSITERCYAAGNQWGSGIGHTRGLRATSSRDTLDGNELSNLTVNCEDSQIIAPNSRNSGYTGINIGHDREASNASRTLLLGGLSENNNYEGLTVAGSSDVTVKGLYCNNNGENISSASFRYGISNLANCERLHLIGCKVTGSYGPGIYLKSGVGHRIESCKVYENLRSGMQLNLPDVTVSDCEVYNNNLLSDSVNRAGIFLESGRSKITNTNIYDTRTTAKNTIVATQGQTVFPYTFKVDEAVNSSGNPTGLPVPSQIRVERRGTPLTLTTDYTVSGVGSAGGNVTIITGTQNAGDEIVISGAPDSLSDTHYAAAAQTAFAYNFDPTNTADLRVIKNGDLLTLTTDYTVAPNAGVGGVVTLTSGATLNDKIRITVVSQNFGAFATGGLHQFVGCSFVGNMQGPTKVSSGGDIDVTSTTIGNDPMGGTFNLAVNQTSTVVNNDNATSASRIILVPRYSSAYAGLEAFVTSVVEGESFTVNHNTGNNQVYNYIIM